MAHDLEQLGPTGFQDLAAALAKAVVGPGVEPMGRGRDGGRDLVFSGRIPWTGEVGTAGEIWDGYTVFQVKHKATISARPADNAEWLWGEIRDELALWADARNGRNPVPANIVIITNVSLTPTPGVGGRDKLLDRIHQYATKLAEERIDVDQEEAEFRRQERVMRLATIKNWKFWHGVEIQTMLNTHAGVRRAFKAFLTPADVFASLAQFTDRLPIQKLEPGLRAHALTTLMGDGYIYFDEAGGGTSSAIPLHEVAIDLPVTLNAGRVQSSVLKYVLDRAEHVLRPSMDANTTPRHIIVTGAPGNGKTTVSKFLVQVFRAALVNGGVLGQDQQSVIAGTESALARFGRVLPKHRRWPMRVDLAKYAEDGGLLDESTLLKWIAARVSARSNAGSIAPAALQSWFRQWPSFIILDGLDEVTEPQVRKRLIERVTEFVNDAESGDHDLLVVLTTRPMGYTEDIAPTQFERIDLDYLHLGEAVRYGTLAAKVRLRNDVDRLEMVVRRLREAADDESLRYLLRTPLQVLILTIIVENSAHLAPDRYSLFWGYYDTVVKRELNKDGSAGLQHLLREHKQLIEQLHQRVGFELQVKSEAGERSYSTLSRDELRAVMWDLLTEAEFKPGGAHRDLLEQLLKAATHRLVLIVPRGDIDGYGFDVRSLQELMAAVYLTIGSFERTLERLRIAAPNPHWRNTWIFAAGRIFALPQPQQHSALVDLVQYLDKGAHSRLGNVVPIAPRLSLELTDDGMARATPRWRNRFISKGLEVLSEPPSNDFPALIRALVRFADAADENRSAVAAGLRTALGGTPIARSNAIKAQALIPQIVDELSAGKAVRGLGLVLASPGHKASPTPAANWTEFEEELVTYPTTYKARELLVSSIAAVRTLAGSGDQTKAAAAITDVLSNDEAAKALDEALLMVVGGSPATFIAIRDVVLPTVDRAPIGETLRSG